MANIKLTGERGARAGELPETTTNSKSWNKKRHTGECTEKLTFIFFISSYGCETLFCNRISDVRSIQIRSIYLRCGTVKDCLHTCVCRRASEEGEEGAIRIFHIKNFSLGWKTKGHCLLLNVKRNDFHEFAPFESRCLLYSSMGKILILSFPPSRH